jgi:hypothetical protein
MPRLLRREENRDTIARLARQSSDGAQDGAQNMDSEYILSSHLLAERPGGLDFFDLTELHAWAVARSLGSLSEALPPAESGKRIQMAMIPSYIGEHVRKVVGDDMAEARIKAQPVRFASYSEEVREAAPLWVYSSVLTGELEAQLLAAVKAGELKLYDESGTPRTGNLAPDQDHAGSADSPASASKSRPGRKPSKASVVLEKILDALEDYASATGQDFDRHAMPGPRGESYEDEGGFHWLCATLYPGIFRKAKDTFAKHRAGICAVKSYAKPTDFYRLALPHIAPKLGVTPNVRHMPKGGRKIS